jgi:hypothetical protein
LIKNSAECAYQQYNLHSVPLMVKAKANKLALCNAG